jgi:diguanylate cyclase (GGDEF)-like protein
MSCPLWLKPVGDLVLGTERHQRLRVARTLMAAYVYLICMFILLRGAFLGMCKEEHAYALIAYMSVGVTIFYLLLRSGWSCRRKDKGLVIEQSLFAITAIVVAYGIVGQARGAVLLLLALVLSFGMFTLTPRQTLAIGGFAVVMLAVVMAVLAQMEPNRFPPQLEVIQFGLAVSVLPTMSLVAKQVSELRERLLKQRRELHEALARVQELATRDSLTNLINRRHMQELLDQELKREERSGSLFCVAIVDLDHFKRINDTYGHQVGDEVLCGFVREALVVLRNADVMARWGGEEFLILFPETRAEQALAGLERLRDHVVTQSVSESVPELRVTFSAGLAEHVHGQSVRQSLERADHALYDAKACGRNRVIQAPAPAGRRPDPSERGAA